MVSFKVSDTRGVFVQYMFACVDQTEWLDLIETEYFKKPLYNNYLGQLLEMAWKLVHF